MKKYIDIPLIYKYSHIPKEDIHGMMNLYFNSKSKEIGNYQCPSCSHNSSKILYKHDNILFDNSILNHVIDHNYEPSREIMKKVEKVQKLKKNNKINIKATFERENNKNKFVIDRNQILILDSLLNYGKDKLYMDKGKNLRYSEHSGLLDFNKHNLEKILISAQTNRQDKDDPEILLPQNMIDALDYEFMFHTHPPTPYPGARAQQGILYEFPSTSDILHFIQHYNAGDTQGSMVITPEGMYIIHSKTGDDKININEDEAMKISSDVFDIQRDAIDKYGVDYLKTDIFYTKVMVDFKYINEFNKILKKYLDDQIYVEYIPRKFDKSGNYVIDKLIIELKPIEPKIN